MIVDYLSHAKTYEAMHPGLKAGFEFLRDHDLEAIEVGRYDLPGDTGFVLIQAYDSKDEDVAKMEAHRNYIDIQYMISGQEQMGYIPVTDGTLTQAYNPDKDVMFFAETGSMTRFCPGMFAIFFPQDGHKPGVRLEQTLPIKKAVVKVKL